MQNHPHSPESNKPVITLKVQSDGSILPEDWQVVKMASEVGPKYFLIIGVIRRAVCCVVESSDPSQPIVIFSPKDVVGMPLGLLQQTANVRIQLEQEETSSPQKTGLQTIFRVSKESRNLILALLVTLGSLVLVRSIPPYSSQKDRQATPATTPALPKKEQESLQGKFGIPEHPSSIKPYKD